MTKIADILENLKLEPMLKSDFRGRAPVLRFHKKMMFLIFQIKKLYSRGLCRAWPKTSFCDFKCATIMPQPTHILLLEELML